MLEYDFFSDLSQGLLQKHPQMKGAKAAAEFIIASLEKEPERKGIYAAVLETLHGLGIDLRPVTLPENAAAYESLWTVISVESAASFQKLTMSGRVALLEGQDEGSWPNTFLSGWCA